LRYALFLGCTIPARQNNYDASARRVSEALGMELQDIDGAGCCGPTFVRSLGYESYLAMAARNLALAEKMELNLLTLCTGCFSSLAEARIRLTEDSKLRDQVNELLGDTGLRFEGKAEVKHFAGVLYHEIGLSKIRALVKKPLKGLKVAVHYGCHLIRPPEITGEANPENPTFLDELVDATGAESVYWPLKLWCCGAPTLAVDESLSLRLARAKIQDAKRAGAGVMVTVCPSCELQFELQQSRMSDISGGSGNLPVLFYPQLLGVALEIDPEKLGFGLNRVPARGVLQLSR
jgi:heterodisulfide reductase subunit B